MRTKSNEKDEKEEEDDDNGFEQKHTLSLRSRRTEATSSCVGKSATRAVRSRTVSSSTWSLSSFCLTRVSTAS